MAPFWYSAGACIPKGSLSASWENVIGYLRLEVHMTNQVYMVTRL